MPPQELEISVVEERASVGGTLAAMDTASAELQPKVGQSALRRIRILRANKYVIEGPGHRQAFFLKPVDRHPQRDCGRPRKTTPSSSAKELRSRSLRPWRAARLGWLGTTVPDVPGVLLA